MLRVEAVGFKVNQRNLLNDVSFNIRSGEFIAIMGANGAGKSTLMKLLSAEQTPTSGTISLHGKDLFTYSRKELSTKRAMLQQQNAISMPFSVEEVVMMGRYGQYGHKPVHRDEVAVAEAMEVCGLTDMADRTLLTMSGGEQQRVHLARVLAQLWDQKEAVLLLDEPLNNMDLQFQHQTLGIASALAKKGFIVISVLHDINLAAQYVSRMILMKGGRKWWDGSPAEVLSPAHIYNTFSINARVYTDDHTLRTQIIPDEICLDAQTFNSNMNPEASVIIL
ncbi:heme ABC transporter ATP-binding protein [Mucilaginibacter sp. JRF]|uniref:heme ABC transporter ATP-binding protein n=1 Tax=Mucilaginibacter sp. JRF TaxID=2780088 RepID=UPI001880A18F|nr:heme ABC transporter ATP-binding protein [Mucilaginibacter sp. JRF]MBE9586200.1 heme ABC transporter ATP-binding protein [Mucilaginibacter sp. JRF]